MGFGATGAAGWFGENNSVWGVARLAPGAATPGMLFTCECSSTSGARASVPNISFDIPCGAGVRCSSTSWSMRLLHSVPASPFFSGLGRCAITFASCCLSVNSEPAARAAACAAGKSAMASSTAALYSAVSLFSRALSSASNCALNSVQGSCGSTYFLASARCSANCAACCCASACCCAATC